MKKTYMIPALKVAEIEGADGILQDLSGNLYGTGNGGTTSEGGITEVDVKEQRGGSLWDDEW